MPRGALSILPLALAAFLGATSTEALAGAWTQAEGRGQIIFSSGREIAPVSAFASGVADSDTSFTQVTLEYGLLDSLTVGARLYLDLSATDLTDGRANAGLLVRQRVWQDGAGNVASVEVSGSLPFERFVSGAMAASNPDSTPETGFGALYGASWWGDWGSAWLSTAAGWVWRGEGQADELRGELSGGWRFRLCCAAILGLYGAQPVAGENEASLRIAPSFAWTLFPEIARNRPKPSGPINATTLQIGLSHDLLDSSDGLGFQIAWWRPF